MEYLEYNIISPKGNKKPLMWALIFLGLAIVGIVVYFLMKKPTVNDTSESEVPAPFVPTDDSELLSVPTTDSTTSSKKTNTTTSSKKTSSVKVNFDKTLTKGVKGEEVKALQRLLNAIFDKKGKSTNVPVKLVIDGVFGDKTFKALKEYFNISMPVKLSFIQFNARNNYNLLIDTDGTIKMLENKPFDGSDWLKYTV